MDNLDFIKAFKNMKSLTTICEENGINYSNLINGKTTKENENKISEKIKSEIFKMFALSLDIKMEG